MKMTKPVLNETYQVLPKKEADINNESFVLKIIDPDHELYDWVFQVNALTFKEPENPEEEDEAKLTIHYDVLEPASLPEGYESSEDEKIVSSLGDIIIDILTLALENDKFTIKEEEVKEVLEQGVPLE
jgi:hypothetical protein